MRWLRIAVEAVATSWKRSSVVERLYSTGFLASIIYLLVAVTSLSIATRVSIVGAVFLFGLIYLNPQWSLTYIGEISFAVAVVTYIWAPETTKEREFYAVTAQVVPVLFLALGLERRFFQVQTRMNASDRHFVALPAIVLFLAAASSFQALSGRPEDASLKLVAAALALGGASLLITAIAGTTKK